MDVHRQQGENPGGRCHPGRSAQLLSRASLPPHTGLPGEGLLRHRRGLGNGRERAQLPGHAADLCPAVQSDRDPELADSQGGVARRQREDVPQGPGVDQRLAARRAPGQGDQDAPHSVERFFLPELAGLRHEGLRLHTGELYT